jgi:hypothetical protein
MYTCLLSDHVHELHKWAYGVERVNVSRDGVSAPCAFGHVNVLVASMRTVIGKEARRPAQSYCRR